MKQHHSSLFAVLLLLLPTIGRAQNSRTFELPSLIIYPDQEYLQKGIPARLSCQIIAGWSGATLHDVKWLKDGFHIRDDIERDDYIIDGPTLNITGIKHTEGEYQCQGILRNVVLSNFQIVSTQLISSPLKLRKARITKFERVKDIIIYAREGSVARLPCAGLPDVVPGPPSIFFEKEETNETLGSSTGDNKYLSSSTGMQIANVQPTDEGRYFCIVRNDFTKMQRKSPKPVLLKVDPMIPVNGTLEEFPLVRDHPAETSSIDRPITVDVVVGQNVLLECVYKHGKIHWDKLNATNEADLARVHQAWGNMKIVNASQYDAGIYVCHAASMFRDEDGMRTKEEVYYEVVVHAATDVSLTLDEQAEDKSWMISCYAINLRYEIPMVFVNATPLVDAVDAMGIATSTNFFTNPVNVTVKSETSFSGSVQCISRPAMEEAEIYGTGLERGRSKNYYVIGGKFKDESLFTVKPTNLTVLEGQDASLLCNTRKVKQKYFQKDGRNLQVYGDKTRFTQGVLFIKSVNSSDEGWYTCVAKGDGQESTASAYLTVIGNAPTGSPEMTTPPPPPEEELKPRKKFEKSTVVGVRGFVSGNDVRLQWGLEGEPESTERVASFVVQQLKESETKWVDAARVQGHIRAATISNLTPSTKYKFRVTAVNDDKTASTGPETDWMQARNPTREVIPAPPKIVEVEALTSHSMRLRWSHDSPHENTAAHRFIITHVQEGSTDFTTHSINPNRSSHVIGGLSSNTSYLFEMFAENDAGRSVGSRVVGERTMHPSMESNGLMALLGKGITGLVDDWSGKIILIVVGCVLLLLIGVLICCLCCTIGKNQHVGGGERVAKSGNGKYLDTSYRIFNEQKVQKSKVERPYYDHNAMNGLYATECIDENVPLRGNNNDDHLSLHSRNSFLYRRDGTVPNVYGQGDEESEGEGDPLAPLDAHYGMMMGNGGIQYAMTGATTARCYSTDTGMSREVLVPPPPPLLSTGGAPYTPTRIISPQPPIPPLINTSCSPHHKMPTTVAYKCGTDTVVAYSPASLAESGGSGSAQTRTTNADSPTHALTDGSDHSSARDSSRNSQISSQDGRFVSLHTFKTAPPVLTTLSTFSTVPR